ncbi:MAG: COG4315 family predicted lipoprotein [Egibacteraceae bacterium]
MQHPILHRGVRDAAVGVLAAIVLSACGTPTAQQASQAETEQATTSSASVQVADSSLGQILTNAEGFTLYAFDNDEDQPQSTCEDACATTWPPLLVGESNVTSDGIDQALIDLSPRKDGTVQVRANSWPLYTFSGDQAPGDTNGQGSGGVWHVVGTDGKPIREAAAASPSSYSY